MSELILYWGKLFFFFKEETSVENKVLANVILRHGILKGKKNAAYVSVLEESGPASHGQDHILVPDNAQTDRLGVKGSGKVLQSAKKFSS